jgi:hypothetical protein
MHASPCFQFAGVATCSEHVTQVNHGTRRHGVHTEGKVRLDCRDLLVCSQLERVDDTHDLTYGEESSKGGVKHGGQREEGTRRLGAKNVQEAWGTTKPGEAWHLDIALKVAAGGGGVQNRQLEAFVGADNEDLAVRGAQKKSSPPGQ